MARDVHSTYSKKEKIAQFKQTSILRVKLIIFKILIGMKDRLPGRQSGFAGWHKCIKISDSTGIKKISKNS
jgi:hypothetical protein